jgi:hypothetical protein
VWVWVEPIDPVLSFGMVESESPPICLISTMLTMGAGW